MFILFPMAVLSAEEKRTNKVEFALFFKINKSKQFKQLIVKDGTISINESLHLPYFYLNLCTYDTTMKNTTYHFPLTN